MAITWLRLLEQKRVWHYYILPTTLSTTTTTTKPFVPSIWGRLHEPKENYARSGTWISFLHSFLSSNMSSLRPLASVSCRITSIHVIFGLPCALLICPKLIRSTCRTGASVGLALNWNPAHVFFYMFWPKCRKGLHGKLQKCAHRAKSTWTCIGSYGNFDCLCLHRFLW